MRWRNPRRSLSNFQVACLKYTFLGSEMERITKKNISPSKKYAMKINLAFKGKAFIIHRRVYICQPINQDGETLAVCV